MNDRFLVPEVARNLPKPFDMTWPVPRRSGIEEVRTSTLIDVLDRILAGLELVPAVDPEDPPLDIFLWPDFGSTFMAVTMPTLSSITVRGVEERLKDLGDCPTEEQVEATGLFWVRSVFETLRRIALRTIWFRAREGELIDHVAELLAVVERHIGSQGPYWGRVLVDLIAREIEEPAIPLLERIAASDGLEPVIRQLAGRRLEEIGRRRAALARIIREQKG